MLVKSEIFSLLKTFSDKKIKRLRKFVASEYFVEKKRLRILFGKILEHHPHYEIEKHRIYSETGIMMRYEDSTARNFISTFGKVVQDFLAYEKLNEDEVRRKIYIIESVTEKKNEKYVFKLVNDFTEGLTLNSEIDGESFLARYELGVLRFNKLYTEDKLLKKGPDELIGILDEAMSGILTYFFSVANDAYLGMISFSRNVKFEKEKTVAYKLIRSLMNSVYEIIPEYLHTHLGFIEIQKGFIEAFGDLVSDEKYYSLKSLIKKSEKMLSKNQAAHIYMKLAACCIMKNQDGYDYSTELMSIYKRIFEKKYFTRASGYRLSSELYRNIILHGLNMNKLEWTAGFITDAKKFLEPALSKDLYRFGLAQLHFKNGSYTRAIRFAEKINITHFIFKYDIKNILLRCYCETGLYENALTLIDAYRHILFREKVLSLYRKKLYRKFINYTEKILMNLENADELGFIRNKINKDKKAVYKEWLLEFISGLTMESKAAG